MNKVTIVISTGNAAFENNTNLEIARILRDVAKKLEQDQDVDKLMDANGNLAGYVKFS